MLTIDGAAYSSREAARQIVTERKIEQNGVISPKAINSIKKDDLLFCVPDRFNTGYEEPN